MSPIPVVTVDKMVQQEGEIVKHSIGMKCWCHGADGQPDPNCKEHENGGWLYVNERQIIGLVTAISYHKELMETGVFMPGDCVFSPLSDDLVAEGDKITFTWPLPFGQGDPLIRGAGNADILYYQAVKSIFCIDQNKVVYKEGRDFEFNGRQIIWIWTGKGEDGKRPATNVKYTVKYQGYLEWIAFVPPVTRISNGDDMGAKVMLRMKHMVE